MNEERRQQIFAYFTTLFARIRTFLTDEPRHAPFTPDMLKSHYNFQIYECSDGYVAAGYLGQLGDNFHYNDRREPVDAVIRTLPNMIAGTNAHVVLRIDQLGGSGALAAIFDSVVMDGRRVPTTGWKLLYIATPDYTWPTADADARAVELIGAIRARAFIYRPDATAALQTYARDEPNELISVLQARLAEYRAVVSERNFRERVIHQFLRDNDILLWPTKRRLIYEYRLRRDGERGHVIDFVIERIQRDYVLVELENPNHTIFTRTGDFTAPVNHAEQQVQDWMLWLRQHIAEVEADLPGIVAPGGLIIIGRANTFSEAERARVAMRNENHSIRLATYDDLAEEAENFIRRLLQLE